MKRFFVLVLALVLGCTMLCAVAEEQPQYLPPRDAALDILNDMNSAFSGQPGAFAFNLLYEDTEETIVFGSDHAGSYCVMEYSDTLPGVKTLYFLSDDVNEAYMCASMTYYAASRFMGENQGLLDWLNGAYPAISDHIAAGGEDLYQEYTVTVGEYQPAFAFLDFQVMDEGGVSFAVGIEYEHAMLVW